ncbi:MAG: short-chain dehydrogenase [Sulfuricurvum sp. PC08-66]|nr:MAG: short-chain dehydrogenase [Sulfuricurvum sp. PC08-66]
MSSAPTHGFWRYYGQYRWSEIFAMLRNNTRDPIACDTSAQGKLVVITGATSGIGYATAHTYAAKGANLLCINRNAQKSQQLQAEITSRYGVMCDTLIADLSLIEETRRVAQALLALEKPIDVLILNAGVYLTRQAITQEGLDTVFAVHYLSSFLLIHTLLPKLKRENRARILLVNSEGHRFAPWGLDMENLQFEKGGYSGLTSYGNAKLAQLLSMIEFAKRLEGSSVTLNAMHPGAVESDTGKENGRLYRWFKKHLLAKVLKSAQLSADALYTLGISAQFQGITGKFFNLTTLETPAPPALDAEVASLLWTKTLQIGKIDANQ